MKRKHDGTSLAQSHSVPKKKRKVGNQIQQLILVLVEQQHSLIFISNTTEESETTTYQVSVAILRYIFSVNEWMLSPITAPPVNAQTIFV